MFSMCCGISEIGLLMVETNVILVSEVVLIYETILHWLVTCL